MRRSRRRAGGEGAGCGRQATRPPTTCSACSAESAKKTSPNAPAPGAEVCADQMPPQHRPARPGTPRPAPARPAASPAVAARRAQRRADGDQQEAVRRRRPPRESRRPGGRPGRRAQAHDRIGEQQRREQHRERAQEDGQPDGRVDFARRARRRRRSYVGLPVELVLRQPVLAVGPGSGMSELVRTAHDHRDAIEVVVGRRRRHRPLERAHLPRVRGRRRPAPQAVEEVTTNISCAAPSRYAGVRDRLVERQQVAQELVRRRIVEPPLHARPPEQQLPA